MADLTPEEIQKAHENLHLFLDKRPIRDHGFRGLYGAPSELSIILDMLCLVTNHHDPVGTDWIKSDIAEIAERLSNG